MTFDFTGIVYFRLQVDAGKMRQCGDRTLQVSHV